MSTFITRVAMAAPQRYDRREKGDREADKKKDGESERSISTLAVLRFFTESSKNKQRLPSLSGTPATAMAHAKASGECFVAKLHACDGGALSPRRGCVLSLGCILGD